MEKQRSLCLSWKPTRFLLLSLTLSFCLLLFSCFSLWAVLSPPEIHPESLLLRDAPSRGLSLNPLNLQSLACPLANSSAYTVNTTKITGTHDTCAVAANISVSRKTAGVVDKLGGKTSFAFGANLSDWRLGEDAHLSKPQNSSGFVNSSIYEEHELQREEGVQEVSKVAAAALASSKDDSETSYETRSKEREANVSSGGKVDGGSERNCDVSKGKWVFDESYPLYTNLSCPFIDEGFNCQANGRHDADYTKWRWQPRDCDIPRFNATNMLELIRGKRVVFAGDSINRNQWESLLCLLMGAVKDPTRVYEAHGRRITKDKGIYSFRFVDYQCTVEFYVSHFLVHETKARIGRKRKETLRIDSIDKGSSRWRGADILIFNTGNWWSHFKTKAGINYYQEGKQVYPHLDGLTAYRKAMTTWATWVDRHINPRKTQVFFRSTAPAHFRGGQWNTGGHCREARKPLDEMFIDHPEKDLITLEVIRSMKTPVAFLNVTGLSSYRIDGHPSRYGGNPGKRGSSVEDCSHWCLPGVPDAWNELIYHQLLLSRREIHT